MKLPVLINLVARFCLLCEYSTPFPIFQHHDPGLQAGGEARPDTCTLCGEVMGKNDRWLIRIRCRGWCHEACTDGSDAGPSSGYMRDLCRE